MLKPMSKHAIERIGTLLTQILTFRLMGVRGDPIVLLGERGVYLINVILHVGYAVKPESVAVVV